MDNEIQVKYFNGAWYVVRRDRSYPVKGTAEYHVGIRQGWLAGVPSASGLAVRRYHVR